MGYAEHLEAIGLEGYLMGPSAPAEAPIVDVAEEALTRAAIEAADSLDPAAGIQAARDVLREAWGRVVVEAGGTGNAWAAATADLDELGVTPLQVAAVFLAQGMLIVNGPEPAEDDEPDYWA